MSLEKCKAVLSKAVLNDGRPCDFDEAIPALRELRNAAALEGRDFQIRAISSDGVAADLVEFVDRTFRLFSQDDTSILAFGIGVQCVVNLMNDNDAVRTFFAENYLTKLTSWLQWQHPKQLDYVAAALLNIGKVDGLNLDDKEFVSSLIKAGASGVEFAVHLLQNLVKSHNFSRLYDGASNEGKLFLLQILESAVTGPNDFSGEVQFICSLYKKSCDHLMTKILTVDPFLAQELAVMLEFLASLSYKQGYMELLQKDRSLVISSAYLLRGIHECITQKKTWKESLDEAVNTIKSKEIDLTNKPFFGVKGNLIRLLGNLAYKHAEYQNEIRDAGCIPIVLDSCKLDGDNPFIKEWSILAIRNLCDGNLENQKFIRDLKLEGYDVVQELRMTLDGGDGNVVNIAPLRRD